MLLGGLGLLVLLILLPFRLQEALAVGDVLRDLLPLFNQLLELLLVFEVLV